MSQARLGKSGNYRLTADGISQGFTMVISRASTDRKVRFITSTIKSKSRRGGISFKQEKTIMVYVCKRPRLISARLVLLF